MEKIDEKDNIFGCYISSNIGDESGGIFHEYVWGKNGIDKILKELRHENYGKDLVLILFEFYLNPSKEYLQYFKREVGTYRRKEKSVGIPIFINNENFFSKPEKGRYEFLKNEIFRKLDFLKKKKLDTKIELLKSDLEKILK